VVTTIDVVRTATDVFEFVAGGGPSVMVSVSKGLDSAGAELHAVNAN